MGPTRQTQTYQRKKGGGGGGGGKPLYPKPKMAPLSSTTTHTQHSQRRPPTRLFIQSLQTHIRANLPPPSWSRTWRQWPRSEAWSSRAVLGWGRESEGMRKAQTTAPECMRPSTESAWCPQAHLGCAGGAVWWWWQEGHTSQAQQRLSRRPTTAPSHPTPRWTSARPPPQPAPPCSPCLCGGGRGVWCGGVEVWWWWYEQQENRERGQAHSTHPGRLAPGPSPTPQTKQTAKAPPPPRRIFPPHNLCRCMCALVSSCFVVLSYFTTR